MIERRKDARFLAQAGHAIPVRDEFGRQNLDCHVSSQIVVVGAVNLAHAAGADQRKEFVLFQAAPGQRSIPRCHCGWFGVVGEQARGDLHRRRGKIAAGLIVRAKKRFDFAT